MGKTTIDGLAVRTSKSASAGFGTQRQASASRKMARRAPVRNMGASRGYASGNRNGRPVAYRGHASGAAYTDPLMSRGAAYTDPLMSRAAMQQRTPLALGSGLDDAGDFTGPVRGFVGDGWGEEVDDFTGGAEADWSELLTRINGADDTDWERQGAQGGLLEAGWETRRRDGDLLLADSEALWSDEDELARAWAQEEPEPDDELEQKSDRWFRDELDEELEEEREAERKVKRKKAPRVKKRRRAPIGKIIAATIAAVLVGGGLAVYAWGDGLISKLTGGKSGLWSTFSAILGDEVPFETASDGRTNVLVFGTEGYDMAGTSGNGQHDGSQLTDSIMVISFDQKTKDVALLSLPRDLKVGMACSAGKVNEVFWCNNQAGDNEQAGAEALMKQVGQVLGIRFQYYAHVNWASLISIIDTLGGITVTLDEDIFDYEWTGAVAQAGVPIHVNGEQALGLARARHGTAGGDFTRGNSQQKIVMAIVQKLVDDGVGISEALGILNILGDNLRTNFSTENLKAAIRLVSGFDLANIRQIPLVDYEKNIYYVTTTTLNGVSYVVPVAGISDFSGIHQYVERVFNSDPVKREEAEVLVLNGTETPGLAGVEKERLEALGFKKVTVGNAEVGSCGARYCVYDATGAAPATVKKLAERYGVSAQEGEAPVEGTGGADIVVILSGEWGGE